MTIVETYQHKFSELEKEIQQEKKARETEREAREAEQKAREVERIEAIKNLLRLGTDKVAIAKSYGMAISDVEALASS